MKSQSGIMACIFRCWRDSSLHPDNKVSIGDLPEEVDIVVLRTNGNEWKSLHYALESKLIPELHKKQIKVVRSLHISELLKPDATAEKIFESFFSSTKGLDGLDINIEHPLEDDERQRAQVISEKLRRLLGKDRLFIYDANEEGDVRLIRSQVSNMDYLLFQSYGHLPDRVQTKYNRAFEGYVPPSKFVPGFTFYEEDTMRKYDVMTPFESSYAYQKAKWNPSQGTKGGIFSYAVDRDGVKEGDNALQPTTFEWTKKLKKLL